MSRKIFISFLGTSNYIPCNYYFENDKSKKVENVNYIQEALLSILKSDFSVNDSVFTLCTTKSFQMNYLDNGQYNRETNKNDLTHQGLESCLKNLDLSSEIKYEKIDEGFSETEIWNVFHTVNSIVRKDDSIYLDITHAFRYLPMMGLVLMNYLKVTKNVTVKGIYYGAFEKLGFASEVSKLEIEQRNAPILNLLPLFELNAWTEATSNFLEFGNTKGLSQLVKNKTLNQIDHSSNKQKGVLDVKLRDFSKELLYLGSLFSTNRSIEIFEGTVFNKLKNNISELSNSFEKSPSLAPLNELLTKVNDKIQPFKEKEINNGFIAVSWCIENGLIQQGITLFQEFLVSYIISKISSDFEQDYKNITWRATIHALIVMKEIEEFKYSSENDKMLIESQVYEKLKESTPQNYIAIKGIAQCLSGLRNDINHGGYRDKPMTPENFESQLKGIFTSFIKLI
jgi:CRISPR-associated Csx2 family protein